MKVKAKTFQNEPKFDKNSHLHGQNKQSDQDAPILHRKHRHRNQTPNLLKSIQTTHSDNCLNQDDQQNMLSYVILHNLNYNTNEEMTVLLEEIKFTIHHYTCLHYLLFLHHPFFLDNLVHLLKKKKTSFIKIDIFIYH